MRKNSRVKVAIGLASAMVSAGLAWGVQANADETRPEAGTSTSASAQVQSAGATEEGKDGDQRHRLGEPWNFNGKTALYQTHEVRDPRGILFVSGQTAKEGNTYLHKWDMDKQIDQVFDQVEKYVRDAGYQPGDITQLRYSVTDEDLFFTHFDKVADRLTKAGIKPTSAAIGVERLAQPGVLLEIEAIAVR
ncbi:RidA family protein [Streptomyces sp. NPDC054841]